MDLSGKRGKKAVVAPVAEEIPAGKRATPARNAPADKTIKSKKPKTKTEPASANKTRRGGRTPKISAVAIQEGFQIPDVTEEMVDGIEEQIRRLQAQANYMRDLIVIRKKYGQ